MALPLCRGAQRLCGAPHGVALWSWSAAIWRESVRQGQAWVGALPPLIPHRAAAAHVAAADLCDLLLERAWFPEVCPK